MDKRLNSINARSFPKSNSMYGLSAMSNEGEPLLCYLGVVKNKQGLPLISEQVQIKKLVHEGMIHFETWNVGTLTIKPMEIVHIMIRMRINFNYVVERN